MFRKGVWALLVLLVGPATEVFGQPFSLRKVAPEEERKLIVDYAVFPSSDESRVRLEIYYQLYNYALTFDRVGDLFRARYVTTVKVVTDKGNAPAGNSREEREAVVDRIEKTRSTVDFRTAQVNFDLLPGKYKVEFLIETIGTKAILRRDFDIELKAFDKKMPKLSDIELVQAAGPLDSSKGAGGFGKGELMVIPSLTRSFAGEEDGRLMYYMEVHRGSDSVGEVTVETSLRMGTKGLLYRDSTTVNLAEPITKQLHEISLADYQPGEYELIVSLHGRRYKKLDEKKVEFRVPWTALAILRHDWDTAVDQLELIGDRGEIKEMRKVEDPKEREKAIDRFWAVRDPDPTTEINEMKVVFYYRVDNANRLFSIMNQEGWRTDRGRILVRFGEPDQIDDYPLVPDRYPYQEWHYYQEGRYRKFVFVDVNEDGDYRLQYPYDGLYQRPDF